MFQMKITMRFVAAAAIFALPALSQPDMESSRHEVSGQALGSFVKKTTHDGIENKATHSGGVLGSYRFYFSSRHGVEATYGYAQNTQSYLLTSGRLGVKTRSHEGSGAYFVRFPFRRFTPFALAGAGALVFDPKNNASAERQTRAAFIYGGGADFNLSKHIFLRAQYRGLVYNSPTYDLSALSDVDRITHRAQPSAGIGYHF
jgi:opacity protein-like surface antigen